MRACETTFIDDTKIQSTVIEQGIALCKRYSKHYSLSYFKLMHLYKFQKIIQHRYLSADNVPIGASIIYRVRTKKEALSNPHGYNKEGAYITQHKLFEEKIFNHMFTIINSQIIKKRHKHISMDKVFYKKA